MKAITVAHTSHSSFYYKMVKFIWVFLKYGSAGKNPYPANRICLDNVIVVLESHVLSI